MGLPSPLYSSYEFFISSEDDAFASPLGNEVQVLNSVISGIQICVHLRRFLNESRWKKRFIIRPQR